MKLTALAAAALLACAPAYAEPKAPITMEETAALIGKELAKLSEFVPPLTGMVRWSVADMNEQIDQTNFIVNRGCSGTLIDLDNRYILTASHCVEAQYETITREVVAEDGTVTSEKVRKLKPGTVRQLLFDGALEVREITYRTKLVAVDKTRDLAVVQILADIPNTRAARLSCSDPVRGETAYIVGNPMGNLYSNVVVGIVSSVQRTYGLIDLGSAPDEPLMQISGGVIGGNSGGAAYNDRGELIGVPVAAHRSNEVLGFAVPLHEVKAFLGEKKLSSLDCEAQP